MMDLRRFFYEDGTADAGTGGGADASDTSTNTANTATETNKDASSPVAFDEEFKNLGFESLDAVKAHLKAQKETQISPEEKAKKDNTEKANFIKYFAENDLMSVDDYNKLQSLKDVPNEELVYARFKLDVQEETPDITEEEIKDQFKAEYKLENENAKTKARGLARLAKEANEIKSPLEGKFNTAKSSYDQELSFRAKMPSFNKFVDEQIIKNIPEKLVVFKAKNGEEEVAIDVELTKEDKEEIGKLFKTPKTFSAFLNSEDKTEQLSASITKKVEGYLKSKYSDKAFQQTWDKAHGIGLKNGSNVGAENAFSMQQGKEKHEAKVIGLQESNNKIADVREKLGR